MIFRLYPGLSLVLALSALLFFYDLPAESKSRGKKQWTPSADTPQIKSISIDTAPSDSSALDTAPAQAALDTPAADTVQPDTQPFTARRGSRFYHKRSLAHSPQLEEKNVIVALDTTSLVDTFSPCPICFEEPTTEEDFELEEAIANQVSGIVEFRYRKLDDEEVGRRLNRIGQPLTKNLDRRHLEFFFTPLRSSLEKNALSAGNGYIYFTTGLLDILEDDEEIAAILAHEICHAEFRHVLQDFKLSQKLTIITAIASAVINRAGNIGGIFQVLQDYAAQLVMNGFSRQFELEADAGAKWILETTGHDTDAMRRVLLKLDDLSPDRKARASVFETHPEESDRIKAFDGTRIFNRVQQGDTLSMRLKFQRPRMVGWFKERAVPAIYATLVNETDSPLHVTNLAAQYRALDMPDVKVEVSPGSLWIPQRSYGQIKILVIARHDLSRNPKAIDLTCEVRNPETESQKNSKKEKFKREKIAFHFDLSE